MVDEHETRFLFTMEEVVASATGIGSMAACIPLQFAPRPMPRARLHHTTDFAIWPMSPLTPRLVLHLASLKHLKNNNVDIQGYTRSRTA